VSGGNSQMITVPAHGLEISIMINGAPASAAVLAYRVIDALLAGRLNLAIAPRRMCSWGT
jgi:hypothetical protein